MAVFTFGRVTVAALGTIAVLALAPFAASASSEEPFIIPPPKADLRSDASSSNLKSIVLAGGCFWGVQGVFQHTKGVSNAVSGYAGGSKDTAGYREVSTGTTGHAEAVKITYDPKEVSLGKLLQIYFSVVHDPTELNYQGPDHGTQYRSAIFTSSAEEKKLAEDYISELNATHVYKKPIVTKIEPMTAFYAAENYHQDYLTLHPSQPYIAYNDIPKVENLKKVFAENYRDKPVLVRETGVTN
ncbi:MAG: peptide-methionine (S)-S-oxide reductase MsrA [Xanthobacteraceae bacterium]|nr:peptide-methionine (S)-S-oxide reductase MsrA [Xanthobacteraceae bacterium]